MSSKQQKQKNDLIFKLLKSMNPFFTQSTQKDELRSHINAVLEENRKRSLEEMADIPQESSLESYELSKSQKSEEIMRRAISRVFDITIGRSVSLPLPSQQKMPPNEDEIARQRAARNAKDIINQLQSIQARTYQKFKIAGSLTKYSQSNRKTVQSFATPFQNYSQQNTNNGLFPTNLSNTSVSKFTAITNTLSKYQSPISSYRHQSPAVQIESYKMSKRKSQSISSQKHQRTIKHSFYSQQNKDLKAETIKKALPAKKAQSESSLEICNPHRNASQAPTRITNQTEAMRKRTKVKVCHYSSQKVLKQSHRLDMQILSSRLHYKIAKDDRKYLTIRQLVK